MHAGVVHTSCDCHWPMLAVRQKKRGERDGKGEKIQDTQVCVYAPRETPPQTVVQHHLLYLSSRAATSALGWFSKQ